MLPQKYAKPGYYPTKYSVRYDPVNKEYTVALEGMVLRSGTETAEEVIDYSKGMDS
jgi:hypothetical protein